MPTRFEACTWGDGAWFVLPTHEPGVVSIVPRLHLVMFVVRMWSSVWCQKGSVPKVSHRCHVSSQQILMRLRQAFNLYNEVCVQDHLTVAGQKIMTDFFHQQNVLV